MALIVILSVVIAIVSIILLESKLMKQFVIILFHYVISCLFVNISSYLFTEADYDDTRVHRPHNCFIHFRPAPSCYKLKTDNVKMIQKRP